MNDEEIKAIGMCRLLLNGDITLHVIDYDGGTAYAGTVNKTYNDDLQTVLNLIEKQKADIEDYEKILDIYDERKYRKQYLEEERAKRKNLLYPDSDEIYQRYFEQKEEIEKKDKIIDLMAEYIYDRNAEGAICSELWKKDCEPCIPCIKEYFENKVKEIPEEN